MTDGDEVHRVAADLRQALPLPPGRWATAPVDRLLAAGRRSRRRRTAAGAALAAVVAVVAGAGIWQLDGVRRGVTASPADRPTAAWRGALLGADGRSLLLSYGRGCSGGPDRVVVHEDATTVRIGIVQPPPPSDGCASSYVPRTIEAGLTRPLAGRRLVDQLTGEEHRPVPAARVLRPTYLPSAIPLTPASEGPTEETGPSGWQRYYQPADPRRPTVLIQQSPAAVARPWAGARRVATVSVHGEPAAVLSRPGSSGAEYVLEWTVGGWTRSVSVEPVAADERQRVTGELVRVAESLR
jgi:hypothetical protein